MLREEDVEQAARRFPRPPPSTAGPPIPVRHVRACAPSLSLSLSVKLSRVFFLEINLEINF